MTTATQREALDLLNEVCELSPDVRLGQLLAQLGFLGEDQTGRTLWDIDDEQLLAVLYNHRAELAAVRDRRSLQGGGPEILGEIISSGSTLPKVTPVV